MKYTIGAKHNGVTTLNVFATAISLGLHGVVLYLLFLLLLNNPSINQNKINFSVGVNFSGSSEKILSETHKVSQAKNPDTPALKKIHQKKAQALIGEGSKDLASAPADVLSSFHDASTGQMNGTNEGLNHRSRPLLINAQEIKVPYPEQARARRIEGTVRMKLTVAESGKVIDVDVISGPAYGLRQAALMVARKLFFLPATDEFGHAMVAHVEHEVIFRLRKSF